MPPARSCAVKGVQLTDIPIDGHQHSAHHRQSEYDGQEAKLEGLAERGSMSEQSDSQKMNSTYQYSQAFSYCKLKLFLC